MTTVATATAPNAAAPTTFREALAAFPSGVTIVTTTDRQGRWWGFTASSFCSLSADPALVLVCLADNAQCHPAFLAAESWVIHVLTPEHAELAVRFATRGVDKFSNSDFRPNEKGQPVLDSAAVTLECDAYARHPGGDHTILVGRVREARMRKTVPAVYFRRGFHALPE
ncbi:flavin reductase family protein [Kitasatospora sp. P5_F3]